MSQQTALKKFLLTKTDKRTLKALRIKLLDLQSVMLSLQRPDITLSQVRALFDGVLSEFKVMNHYIKADSDILHSPDFENAIVKLQRDQVHALTEDETKSVECLLVCHCLDFLAKLF